MLAGPVVLDNSPATTLSAIRQRHAQLAQSMTPTGQVTRDRVLEQGDLQTRQLVIIKQRGCAPDKDRQLGENHAQVSARSGLSVGALEVNQRWGKHTMKLGNHRLTQAPRGSVTKQERRTPRYTTQWEEIPLVRA